MSSSALTRAALFAFAALLGACATSPVDNAVVIPYEDGHFESTAQAASRQDATRAAVAKAHAECASRHQDFVASDAYTRWSGTGDEEVHRAISAAGEVMSDAGVPGIVPDVTTDHDYTGVVKFRCK